jgi:hypothetical protein
MPFIEVIEVMPVEGPWEMVEGYGPHPPMIEVCRYCGSLDVESDSFQSHGGTTEGYERCNACGQSSSWCDLSAVI